MEKVNFAYVLRYIYLYLLLFALKRKKPMAHPMKFLLINFSCSNFLASCIAMPIHVAKILTSYLDITPANDICCLGRYFLPLRDQIASALWKANYGTTFKENNHFGTYLSSQSYSKHRISNRTLILIHVKKCKPPAGRLRITRKPRIIWGWLKELRQVFYLECVPHLL